MRLSGSTFVLLEAPSKLKKQIENPFNIQTIVAAGLVVSPECEVELQSDPGSHESVSRQHSSACVPGIAHL